MATTTTDSTPTSTASELLSKASSVISTNPSEAEKLYKKVLSDAADESSSTGPNEQSLRDQETALLRLGELYRDQKNAKGLAEIITASRTFMSSTAKAKTAKLIRTLLTYFNSIPNSLDLLLTTLQSNIAFAKEHKRLFLKHSLEARLAALYLENSRFKDALGILEGLGKELRRLDDKLVLAECFLLESRTYWGFGNLAKSKASLTSARTAGNAIYCPPYLQAQLDMQSGVLHAEDKDWGTAYSYFFEAFENLGNLGTSVGGEEKEALSALKYMLLCKVMLNLPEDLPTLLSHKLASPYASSREVESMRAVALAHQNRDLNEFERVLREYKGELSEDKTIRTHLAGLYDRLLEQNLLRIVEPYEVVEIDWVAECVSGGKGHGSGGDGKGRQGVEAKLSQMILDKVLHGVLDQGRGCLILFDQPEKDNSYGAAIQTLAEVGKVVESLYAKTVKIS